MHIELEAQYGVFKNDVPLQFRGRFRNYHVILWPLGRPTPIKIGELLLPIDANIKMIEESLNATV